MTHVALYRMSEQIKIFIGNLEYTSRYLKVLWIAPDQRVSMGLTDRKRAKI